MKFVALSLLMLLACSPAANLPADKHATKEQIECLIARQSEINACVRPGKTHDEQYACIDGVTTDCRADGGVQ
jgi:hypothetical protein